MTDEAFQKLKKFTEVELKLTPDNVMDKAISFNNLYIHYHNLYVAERGKLKDINNNMRKTYAELYHYYKFEGFDFKLDSKSEIETYVFGNDKYYNSKLQLDKQQLQVDYIKATMDQIQKTSFQVGHYIDLLKIKNGLV
jgi:hypothetical protein